MIFKYYTEVEIVNFYSEKCDLVANIRCCKTCSASHVLYFLIEELKEIC